MEQLRKDLLDLVAIPGPSGFEQEVARTIQEKIEPYISRVEVDEVGNLLAYRDAPKDDSPVLMIMAHMDEVSMVVTSTHGGFARFEFVGSINPAAIVGQPMLILTESGPVPGVTCSPSFHLSQKIERPWLDVGGRINLVEPGDPIVFDTAPRWLDDDRKILACKAVDDRSGCAVLIDTARRLQNTELDFRVIFTFTVQEEVGARGATYAARAMHPKWVIAVDNAYATDAQLGPDIAMALGTGPVIRRFEMLKTGRGTYINFSDPQLVKLLRRAAEQAGLPYEVDARFNLYTDAAGAGRAWADIGATSVSAPRRYSHSPYEITHLESLQNEAVLLAAFLEAFGKK